ncbi:hypothetical protein KCP73_15900 [Salmonella enterica subsp. enterica]|nr:hypothetical protein KCP73_15900 [Salmonella enterica subsp. enterica]
MLPLYSDRVRNALGCANPLYCAPKLTRCAGRRRWNGRGGKSGLIETGAGNAREAVQQSKTAGGEVR